MKRQFTEEHIKNLKIARQRIPGRSTGKHWKVKDTSRMNKARIGEKRGPYSEEWRKNISKGRTGIKTGPPSEETIRKIRESNLGKKRSEKTKKKISDAMKRIPSNFLGKHHSKETKEKIKQTNLRKGITWPEYTRFKKGQIPWNAGKKIQMNTGRTWWKKGHIPWNTGLKKEIDLRVRNMSETLKEFYRTHSQNPEFKKKLSETRRAGRLKQKFPTRETSIEIKVKKFLERRKIKYVHPFNFGDRFQSDFYLPHFNLILECDGTYWHSLKDVIKRDKEKDNLAQKLKFSILHLSEVSIKNNKFIKILKKICV